MHAVDTNVLVYAHRADSPFHDRAADLLRSLTSGKIGWAIPWPCIYEFYSIATHPRIYSPPSTPDQALDQIDAWLSSPSIVLLTEPAQHWNDLRTLLGSCLVVGPLVHDARIASLCAAHGVSELITLDRDFSRFPQFKTVSLLG